MVFPFCIELHQMQDIAEQRAESVSWKKIAEAFSVGAKKLQRAVEKEPVWERFLADARQEMYASAAAEGVMTLRQELRSDDAKARVAAAGKLMNLKPPVRNAPKSKKDELPRMTREAEYWIERDKSFEKMSDGEFAEIVIRDVRKFATMGKIPVGLIRELADELDPPMNDADDETSPPDAKRRSAHRKTVREDIVETMDGAATAFNPSSETPTGHPCSCRAGFSAGPATSCRLCAK